MATQKTDNLDIVASRYSVLERAHTNRLLPKRDLCSDSYQFMRVKLVRKFANVLNGVDLSKAQIGDVLDVMPHHAAMLVAEGWAEEAPHTQGKVLKLESFRKENGK